MKTTLKTAMMASISEVLDTMFFLPVEFSDPAGTETDGIVDEDKTIACRIGFQGRFSGYFTLFVPENMLFTLTENFMGLNPDHITSEHTFGTVKEALNIMAGGTLSGFDDTIEFQLTIPEIIESQQAIIEIIDMNNKISVGKREDEKELVVKTKTTEGSLVLRAVITSGNGS
jgi:hypothetical protein